MKIILFIALTLNFSAMASTNPAIGTWAFPKQKVAGIKIEQSWTVSEKTLRIDVSCSGDRILGHSRAVEAPIVLTKDTIRTIGDEVSHVGALIFGTECTVSLPKGSVFKYKIDDDGAMKLKLPTSWFYKKLRRVK